MSDQSGNAAHGLVDPAQPQASALGLGMAAVIMTIFGFIWLGWGFSVSQPFTDFSSSRTLPAARWISFYIAFLVLLGISIQAIRRGMASLRSLAAPPDSFRTRFSRQFRIISFFEGSACGLVVLLALRFHRLDLLAAGISLVVGLHFFPLARLFQFPAYYAAGAAIVLSDVLSMVLLRAESITLVAGAATGAVLWITAIYTLLLSRKLLRESARPESPRS
jgi:hypothetical protein